MYNNVEQVLPKSRHIETPRVGEQFAGDLVGVQQPIASSYENLTNNAEIGKTSVNGSKYKTIYIDPPWPEIGGGKIKRGADKHYKLMSIDEIRALRPFIDMLAEKNCHIYLWATNNYLPHALDTLDYWKCRYITCVTWMKDRFGLGQYFRGITEHCLFATRGVLPYKVIDNKRQQGVTGFTAPRAKHSRKPDEMRRMIERVSYPPYIELFARERFEGWDCWGNEI